MLVCKPNLSLNRLKSVQTKAKKNKKRFKEYTKSQNKSRRRRLSKTKRVKSEKKKNIFNNLQSQKITIPSTFSISIDVEGVLLVIYNTKKLVERQNIKEFIFDFSKVVKLDDGAATILLSLCYDIDRYRKIVKVNFPMHPDAREYLKQCGFMQFFEKGVHFSKTSLNATLKKGRAKILQKETVPIIHKAMKTVFGEDKKNQNSQGMLIELMTNSVNHAYLNNTKEKSWYISTRHDTLNKNVEFCFVDNGDGIINTIHVKWHKLLYSNEEIIKRAFDGEYRSRTKQKNRGRGLIVIKKNHAKMTVSGLKVITNNVLLDFETNTVTRLKTPFSGTFYSWKLDERCK